MMEHYEFDTIYQFPINDILIDESKNCRGKIPLQSLESLVRSIREQGLQQPIIVRLANEEDATDKPLILVAGFRRTLAHRILEATTIEGIVRDITPLEAVFLNFTENIERDDLNMLQEAHGVARMARIGLSIAEIAKKINQPQHWVRTRSMLLQLEPELQELAAAKMLSQQNVADLYAIKDPKERMASARFIKEKREKGFSGPVKIKIKRPGEEELKNKIAPKKERKRAEMLNLMDYLEKIHFPFGFHNRVLAWCSGEISDNDFMDTVEEQMLEHGLVFEKPEKGGIPDMSELPTS